MRVCLAQLQGETTAPDEGRRALVVRSERYQKREPPTCRRVASTEVITITMLSFQKLKFLPS